VDAAILAGPCAQAIGPPRNTMHGRQLLPTTQFVLIAQRMQQAVFARQAGKG
jgi:hypothetical protein